MLAPDWAGLAVPFVVAGFGESTTCETGVDDCAWVSSLLGLGSTCVACGTGGGGVEENDE
jgi:hypothetical protein